jgi:hypothetical protein
MISLAGAQRLLAAADEQRDAACSLGDSDAILSATAAQHRAREILATFWPARHHAPPARRAPAGLLDRVADMGERPYRHVARPDRQ